jgi:cell wall-associated NlpC family hydrolase
MKENLMHRKSFIATLIPLITVLLCSLTLLTAQSVQASSVHAQVQPDYARYSVSFSGQTAPISVNERSGPGTNYSIVGTAPPNSTFTFSYLAYGTLINDYWMNWLDPRWYGFNYNGSVRWISSALVNGNPPSSQLSNFNRAIAWAINQQGSHNWDGYCEMFVENAYGTTGQYGSAQDAYNALHTHTDWKPAIGALVWFVPNSGTGGFGHVGIYVGQGDFISAAGGSWGVTILSMSYWSNNIATYEGWGKAPSSWPGHS